MGSLDWNTLITGLASGTGVTAVLGLALFKWLEKRREHQAKERQREWEWKEREWERRQTELKQVHDRMEEVIRYWQNRVESIESKDAKRAPR